MARFNWHAFRMDLETLVGRPVDIGEARLVRRRIVAHGTLQEHACNGYQRRDGSEDSDARARGEARERGIERRLAEFFGPRLERFDGDPRGRTVKLHPLTEAEIAAHTERWGAPPRLTYFSRDWGGSLGFDGWR